MKKTAAPKVTFTSAVTPPASDGMWYCNVYLGSQPGQWYPSRAQADDAASACKPRIGVLELKL